MGTYIELTESSSSNENLEREGRQPLLFSSGISDYDYFSVSEIDVGGSGDFIQNGVAENVVEQKDVVQQRLLDKDNKIPGDLHVEGEIDTQGVQQIKERLSGENVVISDTEELRNNETVTDTKADGQSDDEAKHLDKTSDKNISSKQVVSEQNDSEQKDSVQKDSVQKDAEQKDSDSKTSTSNHSNESTTEINDMASLEPTSEKPDNKEKDQSKDDQKEEKQQEEEEYLDILGNGLLKRKILRPGDGRESRPMNGDVVVISLEGRLEDGQIVDKHDSLEFILGDQDVITALDLGVTLMETGQVIELITDSKYAYGVIGRLPEIPPNSGITYTIELLRKGPPPDIGTLSITVRLDMGEKKRIRGNELFAKLDYSGAITSYSKALKILDPNTGSFTEEAEKLQMVLDCRLKCYNNMAACQLKLEFFDAVVNSCKEVLEIQPKNTKALFRIGKALGAKGCLKEAIGFLKKAVKLEPETKIIHQELSKLTKKLSQETQSEKDMYRKMLGTSPATAKSSKDSKSSSWSWVAVGGFGVALVAVGMATAYRYLHH